MQYAKYADDDADDEPMDAELAPFKPNALYGRTYESHEFDEYDELVP